MLAILTAVSCLVLGETKDFWLCGNAVVTEFFGIHKGDSYGYRNDQKLVLKAIFSFQSYIFKIPTLV